MPTEIPIKVVDASAVAAILFGEPEGAEIASRLNGARLMAPILLTFEVASVCLKKMRRHPVQRVTLVSGYHLLFRMDITFNDVDLAETIPLAESHGLTVYDASYLWLARKLNAELVTLDRQLAEAAKQTR